tara:strand:- start:9450 stop:9695 length:246 start_codon:yes stop_codon:yes gene_type:complete
MNIFNELISIADNAVIQTQEEKRQENNDIKKAFAEKLARAAYKALDKEFDLPFWVDFGIESVVIPYAIQCAFHELKSKGVI